MPHDVIDNRTGELAFFFLALTSLTFSAIL
jgi:hypothetical protein